MAKTGSAWGIDLGQCALKAMRCRIGDDPDQIVAEAFDFIEYPKMLGQPDANPAELMKEALETFLSRNTVKGDKVAISVSGQSGLARFIKLPPVESKKIPDIVKYEARQQIPFQLEDVVWDYQQLAGGSVEDGFALETEVGLFAMKRDQVYRALRPFTEVGIEIDFIQLTPLALYNFATFDQMPDVPPVDQYDPENPPPSLIVLSLGADMSDLVVTNGYRVWQRSINLGGNHFTKALTKQMKLTFAKAEHLKRNAMKAEDPKAVFQAMRPVFGELLGEVQRSLSFFQNMDRNAKLGRIVALGNAMKLRGLHKYLAQNLDLEVTELDGYRQLVGPAVTSSPAFKENALSFGVCYGLAVQALGKGRLNTNLVPPEIVKDRKIRAKKPWAVAAVAILLLGCTIGYFGKWREWNSAREDDAYTRAFREADDAKKTSTDADSSYTAAVEDFKKNRDLGLKLANIGERRLAWAELLKTISDCLPRDEKQQADISERNVLYIDSISAEFFPDLTSWKQNAASQIAKLKAQRATTGSKGGGAESDSGTAATPTDAGSGSTPAGPDNSGWVIELRGHHYHNNEKQQGNDAGEFVRKTLIRQLAEKNDLQLGDVDADGRPIRISTRDLGIDVPWLHTASSGPRPATVTDPNAVAAEAAGAQQQPGFAAPGGFAAAVGVRQTAVPVREYDFIVQFAWKPTPLSQRGSPPGKGRPKEAPNG